ncbi:isoflavone reductase family protein [Dendryphion nanum]|uniref:Isoflavone reductase family protein n=1 Tax=Dendryphion nanum TaxID=256645 RepID=A0A9P9ITI8_9PLEO|nr:isoflavone reductase family protein [Dendryphion nanum]
MTTFKTVLLIGAGGNLGVPVLNEFLNSPYKVSILARKESTSKFPEGVPVFKADYTDIEAVQAAMEGQDVVISMVGGIAAGDQQVFIDAALAAGVKRFFPSEFGPYSRGTAFAELNPWVLPHKTAMVDYLRSKESQMSWSSLVTGAFFDWAMKTDFFGFDIATKTVDLIDDGTSIFTSTTLPTIAKAVRLMLDNAEMTKNQYVFVSSFNVSIRDILESVEKITGEKWTVTHLKSEDVIEQGRKMLAGGDFTGIKLLTRGGAFGKRALGDERGHGLWNDKLKLPKDDMEQVLREILQ